MMSRIKLGRLGDSTAAAPVSDSSEFMFLSYLLCEHFKDRAFANLPRLAIGLRLQSSIFLWQYRLYIEFKERPRQLPIIRYPFWSQLTTGNWQLVTVLTIAQGN